jgi:hypothetical protein
VKLTPAQKDESFLCFASLNKILDGEKYNFHTTENKLKFSQ